MNICITKKVRIKYFGKPFKEKNIEMKLENIYGKEIQIEETQPIEMKQMKDTRKEEVYTTEDGDVLVENQLKNTAKAYTGFQPIMLRKVQAKLEESKEERRSLKVLGIMKTKYFMQAKKTQKEEIGAKRTEPFNEGDELLVENQLKTRRKPILDSNPSC
jgi:hypothetical protein